MDPLHDPDTGIRQVVIPLGPVAEFDTEELKRVVMGMDALGYPVAYFFAAKDDD